MTPEVIGEWTVIDRWWTDEPVKHEWAEVEWGARRVVMVLRPGETVWRVYEEPVLRVPATARISGSTR